MCDFVGDSGMFLDGIMASSGQKARCFAPVGGRNGRMPGALRNGLRGVV